MAKDLLENGPSEGELVVALVREVKQNGAYVDLEEYELSLIHISEPTRPY